MRKKIKIISHAKERNSIYLGRMRDMNKIFILYEREIESDFTYS